MYRLHSRDGVHEGTNGHTPSSLQRSSQALPFRAVNRELHTGNALLVGVMVCKLPASMRNVIAWVGIYIHDLTSYTVQFINNLADRTVSKLTKELVYDNNLLVKQQSLAGIQQYYYTAGKLDSIRTIALNGKWISTLFPTFNPLNRLVSVLELIKPSGPDAPDALKYEYSYDAKGNLVLQKAFARYMSSPQFVFLEQTVFSDYDQSINTESRAYGSLS